MRKVKKTKTGLLILFVLCLFNLSAQETTLPSGGKANSSEGSISYSVGQIVYSTSTGINGSVAQGVQQPFEISVVSGIEQAEGINLECIIYPNPTTDYLILKIDTYTVKTYGRASQVLSYQLFDTDGKIIKTDKITTVETKIKTENLEQGSYLLRIIEKEKAIKTFKIIKTQ